MQLLSPARTPWIVRFFRPVNKRPLAAPHISRINLNHPVPFLEQHVNHKWHVPHGRTGMNLDYDARETILFPCQWRTLNLRRRHHLADNRRRGMKGRRMITVIAGVLTIIRTALLRVTSIKAPTGVRLACYQ